MDAGGLHIVEIRGVEELLEFLELLFQGFLFQDAFQPCHLVVRVCGAVHLHHPDLGVDSGSWKVLEV